MEIDNEFKSLIPPLTGEEREELEKSILAEGCRDALVLWGDILIDGQNRYEICKRHNIPYRTVQLDLASRQDVILWMLQNQLARRNLTDFNKARIALKYKNLLTEQADERKRANGIFRGNQYSECKSAILPEVPMLAPPAKQKTRDIIAEMAGVSHGTLRKIEIIDANAPKPVINAVEDNVISINKAYELTKAAKTQPEIKQKLESSSTTEIAQITVEDLQQERELFDKVLKRQSQIITYWSILNGLTYNDYDYQAWLSDLTEEGIENQLRTVDSGVEKAKAIQKRLHEICEERRRLKLIK